MNAENSKHFHISTIGAFSSLSIAMTIPLLCYPVTTPIATSTKVMVVTVQSKMVGEIVFCLLIATVFDILLLFRAVQPMVVIKQHHADNGFLFHAFDLHCILVQRAQFGTTYSRVTGLSFNATTDILAIATQIVSVLPLVIIVLKLEPNLNDTTQIPIVETDTTLAVRHLFIFRANNPILMFKTQQQQRDNGFVPFCVLKQRKQIELASQHESYGARQARKLLPSDSGCRQGGDTRDESVIAPENHDQPANDFEKT